MGFIGLVVIGLVVFIFTQVKTDAVSSRLDSGQVMPVLLTVTDAGQPILSHILLINPKTKRMALVDIPENLGAIFGALGRTDSYEELFREKGIEVYRDALAKMIDQPIPFHILLTREQAGALVDLLGGLSVFVPDSIDVNNNKQITRIPAGSPIVLDGDKIQAFIDYRDKDERDQERDNRKLMFTKSLLTRLGDQAKYLQDGKFLQLAHRQFESNLDERSFANLCKVIAKVDANTMITQRIIGSTRTVDTKGGQKYLLFPHFEGQLVKDSLRQVLANLEASEDPNHGGGMIRIEILNGTTVSGMAKKTKELFQSYGFEVVAMGNSASMDQAATQVIDRKGNPALAERTAKIIKCDKISTQVQSGSAQDVDVTVILGKDFNGWSVKSN